MGALAGSRYELMEDTDNIDEIGNDTYPDVISYFEKLEGFTQKEPPLQYEVTYLFIKRPYMVTNSYYGVPSYEDLVMLLNNVPYISVLEEGDLLYLPAVKDVSSFYTTYNTLGGDKS